MANPIDFQLFAPYHKGVALTGSFSNQYLVGYQILHFSANGTWHEWTRDYGVKSENNQFMIDLAEYEAQVFVWQ